VVCGEDKGDCMKIYTVDEIFDKLENCIEYNLPFSHIRFGDGGIKYIHSILYRDFDQLSIIIQKEGIPNELVVEILDLWGYYARRADFVDTPEVYYTGEFWPRIKKPGKPINYETDIKLRDWRDLYERSEIINDNYCNPESNCLMIVKREGKRTLLDLMKNRKVCIITARPEVKQLFPEVDVVNIVGQWEDQYKNSFETVKKIIQRDARKYDFWLIAAGELGRLYSGMIKEYGGRCLDIGFVIEYWLDGDLHPRFHLFIKQSLTNKLQIVLTEEGRKYEEFI
jgi:hypothetical protein